MEGIPFPFILLSRLRDDRDLAARLRMESTLPTLADPIQHMTVMRWYRTCLMEGRSPFRLDGLQHPVGATLGAFSPLVAQAALFIPLSIFIKNDCLIYNILWFFGLWMTAMGSYYLIFRFVADRAAAAIGGLGVLLSGPVLAHAHGHLELIYLGSVALFLASWIGFVEKPTRASMLAAIFSYWLATACAAYNAVLCIAPATLFVLVAFISQGRRGVWKWSKSRLAWLAGFSILCLPGLCLLFAGPLWSLSNGVTMNRTLAEFRRYGSPLWSYVAPPIQHPLCKSFGIDFYQSLDFSWIESESYLGIVTLLLLFRAAVARTRFRRFGFWWSCLALLMILSFGVEAKIGRFVVPLPGLLLWKALPIFRLIRVPARFNLLAVLAAAVIASASLRDLLAQLKTPRRRFAFLAIATLVMLAELGTLKFTTDRLPKMPECYQAIIWVDPAARFFKAPAYGSGFSETVTACAGYWQGFHRGRTSGGYSGVTNDPFDARVGYNSPFDGRLLAKNDFLSDPEHVALGIVEDVDARDSLWLFMEANDFSHIVLHRWKGSGGKGASARVVGKNCSRPPRSSRTPTRSFSRAIACVLRSDRCLCRRRAGSARGLFGRSCSRAAAVNGPSAIPDPQNLFD